VLALPEFRILGDDSRRSASSNVIVCTSNRCAPDGSVTTVGTARPSTSG
jgi:hypothetical protein